MNVTDASKIFNIPCQTLQNRVHGKYVVAGSGSNTELISEEEQVLVSYCLHMAKLNNKLSLTTQSSINP